MLSYKGCRFPRKLSATIGFPFRKKIDKAFLRGYNFSVAGLVAQLGAHHIRIVGVESSNLFKSTSKPPTFVDQTNVGGLHDIYFVNDVALIMFSGKHRIIATEGSNIILQSKAPYRRQAMLH